MIAEPSARAVLAVAFERAVRHFDLAGLVDRALPPLPPRSARVRLLAVGKAAPEMARGALSAWGARIERSLVVVPDGTPAALEGAEVALLRAAHPVPDERSVVAAERAMELAAGQAKDLLLVLVSGGASALLCLPIAAVTLESKIDVTRALLASGATIDAVNVVRRHLSRIKGGGLTRAASPGRILALLASDVIEGSAYDVGSGPTVPDPTTTGDARTALAAWAPAFASLPLGETLKRSEPSARRQRAKTIASPRDLAEAVAENLADQGLSCHVLPPSRGAPGELALEYERLCASLGPRSAVVRAAEPALAVAPVRQAGRGGRAGHVAALLGGRLRQGFVFLAGASDGVDGTSDAAGAVVDASFRDLGAARIEAALAAFDTASLHEQAGTSLKLGPTGKNFADVHVLARLG